MVDLNDKGPDVSFSSQGPAAEAPQAFDLLNWYKKKRRGRLRDFGAPVAAQPVNFSYVPWFLAHNKARFPYLFPSLFPEGLRHYVTL